MLHDFEVENYNSEVFYSIDDKSKGSGLAVYYNKNLKFTIDKSLTIRNQYFESLGDKLKCDVGYVYVLVLYRFIYNKNMDYLFDQLQFLLEKLVIRQQLTSAT